MNKNFKVGDIVRFTGPTFHRDYDSTVVGTEGNGYKLQIEEAGISAGASDHWDGRWFCTGPYLKLIKRADSKENKPARKKKILYPVGTRVTVVKDLIKGDDSRYVGRSGTVKGYTKLSECSGEKLVHGIKLPYTIHLDGDSIDTYCAVGELKREGVKNHPGETAETPQKSLDLDEVEKLISAAEARLRRELCYANTVNFELRQEVTVLREKVTTLNNPPKKVEKEKNSMGSSIRQKINRLTMSHEDKQLQKYEITSEFGNLTDLGRRVVLDKLFANDPDLRKAVVADLDAVEKEESKGKK